MKKPEIFHLIANMFGNDIFQTFLTEKNDVGKCFYVVAIWDHNLVNMFFAG